jgi:hypothetical protein
VFGRHEPARLFKYLNELVGLYRVTGRIVQTLCKGCRQHVFAGVPGLDDFCFKTVMLDSSEFRFLLAVSDILPNLENWSELALTLGLKTYDTLTLQ